MIITIAFFAHWTCSFPLFLMLPLNFNTNYDGITVVKQSANHAIILANILSYAPRAGFPHLLEAFFSSF